MSGSDSTKVKNSSAENIDIKYLFNTFRKYWVYFIGALILSFGYAFFTNKVSTPVYEVGTSILINEEGNALSGAGTQILQELGMMGADKNFANEMLVLKSYPLIAQAIRNLDFRISYHESTFFTSQELYKTAPFVVLMDQDHPQPLNYRFNVKFNTNGTVTLTGDQDKVQIYSYVSNNTTQNVSSLKVNLTTNFDSTIVNDFYKFRIIANRNFNISELQDKQYSFVFENERRLVRRYQNRLKVEPPDLESTVARLYMNTSTPDKATDFLRELSNSYLQRNIEEKRHASLRTIEYIDDQLGVIKDSLALAEENLQQFRSRNQVVNIAMQSEQIYEELRELQREKAEIEVKLQYFDYIEKHFSDNEEYSDLITPSAMGIDDPVLNNHIQELITLNAERNSFIENNQEKSPYLRKINIQIENLRNIIEENINYIKNTTDITLENLNSRIRQINQSIQEMPRTERELFGMERAFNINDAIYTFLLEKKAEAEIAKASYQADAEIVEPPGIEGNGPVSPKKNLNYIFAFILGIGVPFSIIRATELFRNTVYEPAEVERMVDLPIIGKIYNNNKDTEAVVKEYPKSHIAESFRNLSLNIDFFLHTKQSQVISVNSSISGEGKSLIAQNLAQTLSEKGLRTILVGYDIRKPRLYHSLINAPVVGLSSYLSSQANLDDIIQRTPYNNLDLIYAGTTPPNPFELVSSPKTDELLMILKDQYDFIILDTPPVGIVAEGYILMEKADLNIFVVRMKRTPKDEFAETINEITKKEITPALVLNDLPLRKKKKYGYGYYE